MITHKREIIFSCDAAGERLVTTVDVVRALVSAGFEVETGASILIVKKPLSVCRIE